MNRRNFFQVAAASTLAASLKAKLLTASPSADSIARARPVEVDLGDPATMAGDNWRNPDTDGYVRLEELYPGDPGDLSGTNLRIIDGGEYAILNAEIGTNPATGMHCLGLLDGQQLTDFFSTIQADGDQDVRQFLYEVNPCVEPRRWSGASLLFAPGRDPELRLYSGFGQEHCLGVVRGQKLRALIACVSSRCLSRHQEV